MYLRNMNIDEYYELVKPYIAKAVSDKYDYKNIAKLYNKEQIH